MVEEIAVDRIVSVFIYLLSQIAYAQKIYFSCKRCVVILIINNLLHS